MLNDIKYDIKWYEMIVCWCQIKKNCWLYRTFFTQDGIIRLFNFWANRVHVNVSGYMSSSFTSEKFKTFWVKLLTVMSKIIDHWFSQLPQSTSHHSRCVPQVPLCPPWHLYHHLCGRTTKNDQITTGPRDRRKLAMGSFESWTIHLFHQLYYNMTT